MSKYEDENVLVISRQLFDQLGAFEGISLEPGKYLPSMLDPANNRFLQRDLAEDDPSHKQIIPYAIFRFENKFLSYSGSEDQKFRVEKSKLKSECFRHKKSC